MKLIAHASTLVLEAELLDRVAAVKAGDPLAPVLIVVPSSRLAAHVKGRLAARFGAVLGVSVLHHQALAHRVLEAASAGPAPVLNDDLTSTLFSSVVYREAEGPVCVFVRDHPGAAAAMLAAVTDLREAGLDPAAVSRTLTGQEIETARLYARWSAALDELHAGRGVFDDAGLVRAATARAEVFARGFSAIFHHGAYDLIGVRVELLRALDRGCPVTFLLPADPADESGAFGVRRANAIAGGQGAPPSPDHRRTPASVSFLHAQGARAELQTAAYEALASVEAGASPDEVAIVVRSFQPYLAALDALLDESELPWHTSYRQPLRRNPQASAALGAIAEGNDSGPRSFAAHADDFLRLAGGLDAAPSVQMLLQSMRDLTLLLGDRRAVSRAEAAAWLAARADAATLAPSGADGGGIRILDAMQARGLTFTHLRLAGMNSGFFPRVAREHPFLSDASRARLREATGRPLPTAFERDGEERLLLSMLLHAASDRIGVSWLRADESARPLVPSLALRQVARFANVESAEGAARSVPSHPRARLAAWAATPGLLSPRDELLFAALGSEVGAGAGPAIAARRPEWSAGVRLVAATESFDPAPGPYDGLIGVPGVSGSIAATSLERLGRCPLQYFFRDVLKVDAPPRPGPFSIDARSVGIRVHDALREIYARLGDEGAFAIPLPERIRRASVLLREAWQDHAGLDVVARAERLPVLDRIESSIWIETLDAFLAADLTRLEQEGLIPEHLEHEVTGLIPDDPSGVRVRARFDRVVTGATGRVVGDYKTGRRLANKVTASAMRAGSLQVPIYALISGSAVELLGVGPASDVPVAPFDGFKTDSDRENVLAILRTAIALAQVGRYTMQPGDQCARCDYRSACRYGHPPTLFRASIAAALPEMS